MTERYEPVEVPGGCIECGRVEVVQYVCPDGSLGTCTHYTGDLPLSQVIGLLALGSIDIYLRCNREDPS